MCQSVANRKPKASIHPGPARRAPGKPWRAPGESRGSYHRTYSPGFRRGLACSPGFRRGLACSPDFRRGLACRTHPAIGTSISSGRSPVRPARTASLTASGSVSRSASTPNAFARPT